MKEKLMQFIIEAIEKYDDVKVFFDYNKEDDIFNTCLIFNKSMRLTTIFETLLKLPKKVNSFEQYFEVGSVEYLID